MKHTYLYIKTHSSGLKYLGKTVQNPYTYMGSGTHWIRHLDKHGIEHTTEILFETNDKLLFKETALYYSHLYNIAESNEWANIVHEQGDGGDTPHSPAYQAHIASKNFLYGEKNGFHGMKHTDKTKRKISEANRGRGLGIPKNHGDKLKSVWAEKGHPRKGKEPWNKGKKGSQSRTQNMMESYSIKVIFEGVEYPSLNAASRATGLSAYKIKIATTK